MIRLASRRPVAEETRRNLGLQAGSAEMVENLEIRQVPGTTFIDLTYRGTDRKKATQSLLALGELARWTGRVPARLGGWLVGIGAVVILLAPVSGGWLVGAIGVVALFAARSRRSHPTGEVPGTAGSRSVE